MVEENATTWSDLELLRKLGDPHFPEAPAVLFERHHGRLVRRLRKRHESLQLDDSIFIDAATDAILLVILEPHRFDPSRGVALDSWLLGVASKKLLGYLRKETSHYNRMKAVADSIIIANTQVNGGHHDQFHVLQEAEEQEVMTWLAEVCPDPVEFQVAKLMYDGEHRSEVYARCLGIAHLPRDQIQRQVKQVKDKIQKRMKRRLEGRRYERQE